MKTNVSLACIYVEHFSTRNLRTIGFNIGLQLADNPKLEKLNDLYIDVFEFDNPKNTWKVAFNPL